ncbi:RidA family protein [Nocardioides humi]|uniref:RidA family protein n=1 Tax=Nocardioides humi TaxID=449461 RepID=A0ABN2A4B1_9ACTN|nr:RidA family protein [Nocardioides humi]
MRGYNPPHLRFDGMSQAVRSGDFVVLSGQVALDASAKIATDDPYEQAQQCFENIRLALAEADATLAQVTKLVCYLTDPAHFPSYSKAKGEVFPVDGAPASTTVVVSALLDPRMLLEVEAWAYVGDGSA